MADWQPLRDRLEVVSESVTIGWQELSKLVGGLPPSAMNYREFFSGDRTQWRGFRVTDLQLGRSVTFTRTAGTARPPAVRPVEPSSKLDARRRPFMTRRADVVLVSCAKAKRAHESPAADLYTSPLFRFTRAYAEESRKPWFILSAKHGLVRPDTVLQPYDLNLGDLDPDSRQRWAVRVVEQLASELGGLADVAVEIHAGETYTRDLRGILLQAGAFVGEPLHGLTLGERLAWYSSRATSTDLEPTPHAATSAEAVVTHLTDQSRAVSPAELVASDDATLLQPGMYSWWVDAPGALELSHGLGVVVAPGLIYAGLAGATRRRSLRPSSNTLRGRLVGMHLGARYKFSTFRYSLGSVLANAWGADQIDEARLTRWMHQHLKVIAVPVSDRDALEEIEDQVLGALDPPFNLSKVSSTPLRQRLSALRALYKP